MKQFIKKPFCIGSLSLPHNIICAPLAGCSDRAFRKMIRQYNQGLIFCEMVKMDALVRENVKTCKYLQFDSDMHPIGAQLCGVNPKYASTSAKMVEDAGFDIVDLNCGCPVKKVVKDGSGSALLKTPELIGEIIQEMVRSVKIPVSVKIRIGWNDDQLIAPSIVKIAQSAGASAIFIHGRTKDQAYKGEINYDCIKECKDNADNIKVVGNGNIWNERDAIGMFEKTDVDGVMLARGMFGNPFLIQDILDYDQSQKINSRTFDHIKNALLKHFEYIISYENERKTVLDIRRVGCWYLKGIKGAKALRVAINRAQSIKEVFDLIRSFHWNAL
jgi:tRNA-dihydrouridine synthase B